MTTFRCSAIGVSPSGRAWSFRINFNSGATIAVVENDWLTQITSAWTSGTHGLNLLFPVATVLETTRTAQLQVVPVTIGGVTVNKLREVAVRSDNPALPGVATNPSLPDQNSVLVSLRTGLPGRENRGRIHLPAPDQTLVTASELGSTNASRASTAVIALLTGMAAAGHQPVIVTAKLPHTGTPVGSTRNITTAETDRIIRTERKRNKRQKAVYV